MLYDYKCKKHGIFEIEATMSTTTKTHPCPKCGLDAPKYFGTAANLVFKGGDWSSKKMKVIDPKSDWISRRQKEKWE